MEVEDYVGRLHHRMPWHQALHLSKIRLPETNSSQQRLSLHFSFRRESDTILPKAGYQGLRVPAASTAARCKGPPSCRKA